MARRAADQGFRVMIDFHYSDTWADPGKQAKPAAWASHPFAQLLTDVYDHTFRTMTMLKAAGVTPRVGAGGQRDSGRYALARGQHQKLSRSSPQLHQ